MLKKLQRKVVLVTMLLVTAALAVMAGAILYMQYQQFTNDVRSAVEHAINDNDFGQHAFGQQDGPRAGFEGEQGVAADLSPDDLDGSEAASMPADPGNGAAIAPEGSASENAMRHGEGRMPRFRGENAEMLATSTFLLGEDRTVSEELINALDLDEQTRDDAVSAAVAVFDEQGAPTQFGHLDQEDLYYAIGATAGGTKISFANSSYISSNMQNLQRALGFVLVAAWLAFLVLSILLSRWMVRPAQRAWEQQRQFVADASHELKTPLAVMMANNSILLSHKDQTIESQQRWVESNQDEARQMLDLVNDMLFLARPENEGEHASEPVDVDFSALVQANALQFEAVCFERGVQLTDEITESITVRGNQQRLQRLVGTLVDNACKYADARVNMALKREGRQAVLRVENDGAVIPAEDLPHVFERFYRVDKARVRSEGGVGLGLAIAQEVAREHSGAITVASSQQAGTVFTVTLPSL